MARRCTKRASATSVLALLLAASPAAMALTPSKSECVHSRSRELASLASCGHQGSVAYCLGSLPSYFAQTDLETCFLNAGCTVDEAAIEADWTLRRCDDPENLADLRKRQRTQPGDEEDPADEPATTRRGSNARPTTANQDADETTSQARVARPTASAPRVTAAPTTDAEVVVVTVTSAGPTSSTLVLTPEDGLLVCKTTTMTTINECPVQSTGPDRGKTLGCFPLVFPTAVCVEGLHCVINSDGSDGCMKLRTTLDAAGVIVALVFGVAAAASIIGLCFFSFREKRQQRRAQARAEAALIAKSAALNGKRPVVTTRSVSAQSATSQPLMGAPEPQNLVYQTHENPFHDQHRA